MSEHGKRLLAAASTLIAVRHVALVIAMEAEAAPLRSALGATPLASPPWAANLPMRLSRASAAGPRPAVTLAVNGTDPSTGVDAIGSTAAALATHLALADSLAVHPSAAYRAAGGDAGPVELVLSVGTAGGWQRAGAAIGDVYVAHDRFVCHDRRIPIPGFDQLGLANLAAADLSAHAEPLGCKLGVVTSGDSLDETDVDRERIKASGAEVKEMEAAAVAWVAHLHGVPVGAVKAITDLVDAPETAAEQFLANLATAADALRVVTLGLLDRLGRHEKPAAQPEKSGENLSNDHETP